MEKENISNGEVEKQNCTDDKIQKQKQEIICLINSINDKATLKKVLIYLSIYLGED